MRVREQDHMLAGRDPGRATRVESTVLIPDRRSSDSLGAQATQLLREEILNGRFPQGTRLNELRLANELALSRGPIREALRALEREGVVRSLPNRGSFVSRIPPDYYAEILDLREILEPIAYERSVRRRAHGLAGPLAAVLRAMREAREQHEWGTLSMLHARFHGVLYREAGGRVLGELWARIEVPMRIHINATPWTDERADRLIARHVALADDLVAAELSSGREAILRHLAEARAELPFPFSGVDDPGD